MTSVSDRDIPSHIEGKLGRSTNVSSAITSNEKDDGSEVPDASGHFLELFIS